MGGSTQFAELAWLLRSAEFCTASCTSLLCILYRCYSLSLYIFLAPLKATLLHVRTLAEQKAGKPGTRFCTVGRGLGTS